MKPLFYILLVLAVIPFVMAETTSDALGVYNGTVWNATSITGKVGSALNISLLTTISPPQSNITYNTTLGAPSFNFTSGQSVSVAAWVYLNSLPGASNIAPVFSANNFTFGIATDGKVMFIYQDSAGSSYAHNTSSLLSTNTWYYIIWNIKWGASGSAQIYINGTNRTTSMPCGSGAATPRNNTVPFHTGGYSNAYCGSFTQGLLNASVDELGFWNKTLNAGNISSLYNSGTGKSYAALTAEETTSLLSYWAMGNATSDTYFSMSAIDLYDASSITTFFSNVTVNGSTSTYGTTNGTINFNFTSGSVIINATTWGTSYFPSVTTNHNTSSNLAVTMYQAVANFNATQIIIGNQVVNFTVTAPNGLNSNGTPALYLKAGTYNFTFNKTGWYGLQQQITIPAVTNYTYNFTGVYDTLLNISAFNAISGASVTTFNVTVNSTTYSYQTNQATSNGSAQLPWTSPDTNINITFYGTNYAVSNHIANVSVSGQNNISLSVYTSESILFYFYDELNNTLLNGTNVTVYITSGVYSTSFITPNGTHYIDLLTPADYVITYSAAGYSPRQYYYELADDSTQTIILYLIPTANDDLVLSTVFDTNSQRVENAIIYLQKKNLSGTSYYNIETCNTNVLGQCLLHVDLYDTTYRFLIVYDGLTRLNSGDTQISSSTLSFIINIAGSVLETIYDLNSIQFSLNYSNTTQTFSYTWIDTSGNAQRGCLLTTYRQKALTTTYLDTCTTSASGTITQVINTSLYDEWTANAYIILTDGTKYPLQSLSIQSNAFKAALGKNGLFIFGFLVVGTIMFTGLVNPALPPILGAFAAFLFNSIGLINIGTSAVIALVCLAILVVYSLKR